MTPFRRDDALRARLASFRRRVARAEADVRTALASMRTPYVALSGGKDSLVVLDLVRRARPDVTALWVDDELDTPGTVEYLPSLAADLGVGLRAKTGTQLHGGWFRPWVSAPPWRAPLADCVRTTESIRVLAPRWGFDGVFLGLRADEATRRRVHAAVHGRLFKATGTGLWTAQPIAWWALADVWAYLADRALTPHPAYAQLAAAGVERARQRVGPLPCDQSGWTTRAAWPDVYRRVVERYGAQVGWGA